MAAEELPLMYCHRRPPLLALLPRTGSETPPDVPAFTDTSPRPDVSLLYWQQRRLQSVVNAKAALTRRQ